MGKTSLEKNLYATSIGGDGTLAKPLGMLEHVTVTSCGISFMHTFAMVDFGRDPNYKVILGRPFMRQMLVVQDWG